jgi:hypothetical protein
VDDPVLTTPGTSPEPPHDDPVTEAQVLQALQVTPFDVQRDDTLPGKPVIGVFFSRGDLTDARSQALSKLKQLRSLGFRDADLTDAGLKKLATLGGLENLYINPLKSITNTGLAELAGLRKLKFLGLEGSVLTDQEMKTLGRLKQLERLNLRETRLSLAGLKELTTLENLKKLNLSFTNVTDEGLNVVVGMKHVLELELVGCKQVTQEGLEDLARMTQLQNLTLDEDRARAVTAKLKQALPNLIIDYPQ